MFKLQPYNHQTTAFNETGNKVYAGLLCEMGTGKTAIAIATAAALFAENKINGLLVVAPKTICRNWSEKEIPTHLHSDITSKMVIWRNSSKQLDKELCNLYMGAEVLRIFIVNIEAISTDRCYDECHKFLTRCNALMVIDESTTIKNIKAERTKACMKLGLLASYRRILTGTPVTQSPMDLYSQFQFLKPGCLGSKTFYGFRNQYAVLKKRYVNGRNFDEVVGYQRLDELQARLKPLSYRILKRDCLDLPDKIYEVRYIEPSVEQRRIYELVKTETMAMLRNGQLITAPLMITQILRLRQALCNLTSADGNEQCIDDKYPRIDEILKILEECDGKVIIWANFISSINKIRNEIRKQLGDKSVAIIHGGIKADDRQAIVESFQDNNSEMKYLVAQPRTGGYGLTLTAATTVIYHDNDWSLEVRQQSEDRCHRIGQKNNVTYIDLVAAGTIDERIRAALVGKKEVADLVTGDNLKSLLTD